jgi:Protein of unknown function (DUF4239)
MAFLDRIQVLPLPAMFLAALALAVVLGWLARVASRRLTTWYTIEPGTAVPLKDTVVVITASIYGLLVAFTTAGIWQDISQARAAVQREAQALENVVVLSAAAPKAVQAEISQSVRDYIHLVKTVDWRLMSDRAAMDSAGYDASDKTLVTLLDHVSHALAEQPTALLTATLSQIIELRNARIARLSLASAGATGSQWFGMGLLAFCAMLTVAVTHVHDPRMLRLSTGIYSLVVGATFFIVLAHDRPFVGEISVQPIALVRITPKVAPAAPPVMTPAVTLGLSR